MIYSYKALDSKGDNISDHIDAPTLKAARQKIRSRGHYIVSIQESGDFIEDTGTASDSFIKSFALSIQRSTNAFFSAKHVGIFFRQLSTLLKAGMPLTQSLNSISEQIDNSYFKQVVTDIKGNIEEGSSLSNTLLKHKGLFTDLHINMIRVGENLGSLDQVIERLANLEQKKNALKSKIQAALWYPLFMLSFAMIVMAYLMINVIPTITEIYEGQDVELPLPTEIIIAISNFLSSYWLIIPLLMLMAFFFYYRLKQTAEGKVKLDSFKLRLPIISGFYKKLLVMQFSQNLGILLSNKVEVIKSFEIVQGIINNSIIEKDIEDASARVKEGSSIAQAFGNSIFIPKIVLGMISAGEASDTIDEMLIDIGTVYENEVDLTVTSLTSLLEPVIIVIMGVMIGTIVMSIMMPMMEMNLLVK